MELSVFVAASVVVDPEGALAGFRSGLLCSTAQRVSGFIREISGRLTESVYAHTSMS